MTSMNKTVLLILLLLLVSCRIFRPEITGPDIDKETEIRQTMSSLGEDLQADFIFDSTDSTIIISPEFGRDVWFNLLRVEMITHRPHQQNVKFILSKSGVQKGNRSFPFVAKRDTISFIIGKRFHIDDSSHGIVLAGKKK